jgi:hypothetical protein
MRPADHNLIQSQSPSVLGIWEETPKVSMNRITLLRLVVRRVNDTTNTLREDARKVTHATG